MNKLPITFDARCYFRNVGWIITEKSYICSRTSSGAHKRNQSQMLIHYIEIMYSL